MGEEYEQTFKGELPDIIKQWGGNFSHKTLTLESHMPPQFKPFGTGLRVYDAIPLCIYTRTGLLFCPLKSG